MQPKPQIWTGSWQGPDGVTLAFATADTLVAPELKALLAYWIAKAAGRVAPTKAELNPKDIPSLLRNLHLYEVLDNGRAFRLRLVGTQVVEAVGNDPTGKVVTAGDADPMYRRVFAILPQVLLHRRPIQVQAQRSLAPQRNFLPAESLILPLSDDGTAIDKILVSTIFRHIPPVSDVGILPTL